MAVEFVKAVRSSAAEACKEGEKGERQGLRCEGRDNWKVLYRINKVGRGLGANLRLISLRVCGRRKYIVHE